MEKENNKKRKKNRYGASTTSGSSADLHLSHVQNDAGSDSNEYDNGSNGGLQKQRGAGEGLNMIR